MSLQMPGEALLTGFLAFYEHLENSLYSLAHNVVSVKGEPLLQAFCMAGSNEVWKD